MAIKELENICKESAEEFQEGIKNLYVCHKIGFVATREASILVCCSGGHRDAPMKAVRNIVNSLKSRVTIWKKFLPLEQNDSTFKETWLKQSEAFWLNNNSGQQQ
jgi:molybdopterin synthase catalytic subunit